MWPQFVVVSTRQRTQIDKDGFTPFLIQKLERDKFLVSKYLKEKFDRRVEQSSDIHSVGTCDEV